MVCPACGLPNDPAATTCVRCHAGLTAFTPPPRPPAQQFGGQQFGGQQFGGPHPGQPFPGPPMPPPRRRSALPWVAGASVLVIILALVGIAVVLSRDPAKPDPPVAAATTPATTATAPAGETPPEETPETSPQPDQGGTTRDQLAVIDGVLDQSIASRRKLNAAIDKVNRCTDLSQAVTDMTDVGDERRDQLGTVTSAALDQVPGGEQVRALLITALQRALAADQGFVGWAKPARAPGCADSAARTTAYDQGQAASKQAGTAKGAFLAVWNPLATANGLKERSRDDI